MEAGNYKDALSLLEKSLKMNKQILGETHASNAQILLVIGQVYTRQKDFERALNVLADAWELFDLNHGKNSEQVGNCFLEIAAIHHRKKDFQEAINFQSKALDVFSSLEKFSNTEFLAAISITLAEI
jgi:tetratricopeptide (TPR) repeat protein